MPASGQLQLAAFRHLYRDGDAQRLPDGSRQNSYTLRYNISPSVHWNIDTTFGHISGRRVRHRAWPLR
jgi:hypothetical protein